MLGTAGIIVMHDGTDLLEVMSRIAHFYMHESCGQCTPCRQGTGWLYRIVEQLRRGEGAPAELDLLWQACGQIEGNTICALGDAAAWPLKSFIRRLRPRLEAEVARRARRVA
jgi:NADH-quinone oxidoreductase subunit F